MNVERWVAKRRAVWQKLEALLKQVDKRGLAGLNRDELQALGRLYRSVSADLSGIRQLATEIVNLRRLRLSDALSGYDRLIAQLAERLEREVGRLREDMRQSRDPGAVDAQNASGAALEQ